MTIMNYMKKSPAYLSYYFIKKHTACITRMAERLAHTDIHMPDFSDDLSKKAKNPKVISRHCEPQKLVLPHFIMAAASVVALYGIKAEIHRYVLFMAPSADVLALARIEVNLSEIPEGKNVTFKWRGKPLFVRHRAPEHIKAARDVDITLLRDPAKDEDICKNEKYLVCIGICTHLGCVPIADAGDFGPGGYYCPCHGSHFDSAGRIRQGPAPTNMEIPEHEFVGDHTLVVG